MGEPMQSRARLQDISAPSAQFFCEPKTALKITNKHTNPPTNKQNPPTALYLLQIKSQSFARAYNALYDLSLSILGPLCAHPCFSHTR